MNILLKHITRNMKENVGRTTLIMLSLFVVSILVAIITLGILSLVNLTEISALAGEYYGGVFLFIWAVLITNGVIEGGLAVLVAPSAYLPLKTFLNRKYNNFDENDLKHVVAQYLRSKGYRCESKDVYFKLGTKSFGYGMYGEEKTVFKGCDVRVTK